MFSEKENVKITKVRKKFSENFEKVFRPQVGSKFKFKTIGISFKMPTAPCKIPVKWIPTNVMY